MIQIQTGFFTLLGLIFIVLKLTGVLTLSWWLVTLPLWFGCACALIVLALAVIAEVIAIAKRK